MKNHQPESLNRFVSCLHGNNKKNGRGGCDDCDTDLRRRHVGSYNNVNNGLFGVHIIVTLMLKIKYSDSI